MLQQALSANSDTWIEMSRDIDMAQMIQTGLQRGCQNVIAAGGDGTINAIVNAMMKIDEVRRPNLAVFPLGTANDFAGTLAIPDDLNQAVEVFRESQPIAVDVVRIHGSGVERYYANVAAGGNCVRVSEELTDELKTRWGAFSYVRGAVGVLADMNSYRITAEIDGERLDGFDSWAVLVANGKTNAGRIQVAPQASPVDGLIDVVLIRDGDLMDMVEVVTGNLLGNFLECEQVVFRKAKRLRIQSDPPMRFTLDGEVIDEEPVAFEAVPGAIRMFVGQDFARE
ncbi:Diacylglycerol kinase [Novipirellula galeiformis]|uniref:Diacylglycerol kinase n=2 Tax=Novipirellula galeiformis TaxID=2528004 RepID=A0A5C6CF18_9BACT|nr:Diacylglycerol kinase [Novipirellula galeiformis]